jgi:hypothetical protein
MVRTRVRLMALALLLAGAAFGFMTASAPYAYGANNSRTASGASRSARSIVAIRIPGCEPFVSNQPLDAIAMAPNGRTAYTACVTGPKGGIVTPINLATNTVGKSITVKISTVHGVSWGIAITPNGRTVYVSTGSGAFTSTGWGAGAVIPVTLATSTVGAPIIVGETGYSAQPIMITPNGRTAYYVSGPLRYTPEPRLYVTPIDLATNTAGTPIKLGECSGNGFQAPGAITPNGKTLWIDLSCNGLLTPINVATNTLGTPIKLPMLHGYIANDSGDIAIAPNGRTAFVSSSYSGRLRITPVNLATRTVGAPPRRPLSNPTGFAISAQV